MPWSRKKVVRDLESTLMVSVIAGEAPLFRISHSAVNSLPSSHPIETIPDRQLASVRSRSGDSGRVLGTFSWQWVRRRPMRNSEVIVSRHADEKSTFRGSAVDLHTESAELNSSASDARWETTQHCMLRSSVQIRYRVESRGPGAENTPITDGTFMNFRGPQALNDN